MFANQCSSIDPALGSASCATQLEDPSLLEKNSNVCHICAGGYLDGVTPAASTNSGEKLLHLDFFAACRSPELRELAPFPKDLEPQCRLNNFAPFQCLRQLALIELVDKTLMDLPSTHVGLLIEVRRCRVSGDCQYQVLSEVHEAAVQRLIQYSRDSARNYANMRVPGSRATKQRRQSEKC